MGLSKTSDHINIKIKMPNSSQELPSSFKAPNQDLKDMDVLCTFEIKIESQNSEYGCIKDQWPYPSWHQGAKSWSRTSSILQSPESGLKGHEYPLYLQNQYREPIFGIRICKRKVITSKSRLRCINPVSNLQHPPKPILGLNDMDVLCTFKIKIDSQNLESECTKDQQPYTNQDKDVKPQSGNSSILKNPKSGLKRHGFFLHLQNPERVPKFGICIHERPATIYKPR